MTGTAFLSPTKTCRKKLGSAAQTGVAYVASGNSTVDPPIVVSRAVKREGPTQTSVIFALMAMGLMALM